MSVERRSFFFPFFFLFFFFKARYTRGGPIEQTLRVTRLGEYAGRVILHIEKPARTRACVTTTTTMKEREEKKKSAVRYRGTIKPMDRQIFLAAVSFISPAQ